MTYSRYRPIGERLNGAWLPGTPLRDAQSLDDQRRLTGSGVSCAIDDRQLHETGVSGYGDAEGAPR